MNRTYGTGIHLVTNSIHSAVKKDCIHLYNKVSINMVSPTIDGRNPPEQLRYTETMENPFKAGSYPSQLVHRIQGITIKIWPSLALWVSCHDLLLFSVTLLRWRSHWKLLGVSCPASHVNLELNWRYIELSYYPKKLSFVRVGNQTLVRS